MKISCTFMSRTDLEGVRDILAFLDEDMLSPFHATIRERALKSIEKRLK